MQSFCNEQKLLFYFEKSSKRGPISSDFDHENKESCQLENVFRVIYYE